MSTPGSWHDRMYHEAVARAKAAEADVERLRAAIRKHRDYRGDSRCWRDDDELYAVLPEGFTPPERDTSVELERCKQFIECRHNPATTYVSPQKRIDELEAENAALRRELSEFAGKPTITKNRTEYSVGRNARGTLFYLFDGGWSEDNCDWFNTMDEAEAALAKVKGGKR